MDNNKKQLLSRIEFWNLIVLILGGILGYFFIHLPLMTSQTKQMDVETKLSNLELELKEIKGKLDITQTKVQITSEILNIVNNLTPRITITQDDTKVKNPKEFKISAIIKNIGKYNCFLKDTEIILSTTVNPSEGKILILGKDYTAELEKGISTLMPNKEETYVYAVKLNPENNDRLPGKIFSTVNFVFETIPNIKKTAMLFLKEIFQEQELEQFSRTKVKSIKAVNLNK